MQRRRLHGWCWNVRLLDLAGEHSEQGLQIDVRERAAHLLLLLVAGPWRQRVEDEVTLDEPVAVAASRTDEVEGRDAAVRSGGGTSSLRRPDLQREPGQTEEEGRSSGMVREVSASLKDSAQFASWGDHQANLSIA